MDTRVGFVGVIIESTDRAKENVSFVNSVLSDYGKFIIARLGIPYKEKSCNVINLVVDINTDKLGELTGKLGNIEGVTVKSALSKNK